VALGGAVPRRGIGPHTAQHQSDGSGFRVEGEGVQVSRFRV
jgi:hypothetical protein